MRQDGQRREVKGVKRTRKIKKVKYTVMRMRTPIKAPYTEASAMRALEKSIHGLANYCEIYWLIRWQAHPTISSICLV